jgi:hypothetical protein
MLIPVAARSKGLRLRPVAARLLGLRVRILPKAWVSTYCECYVLSGRGLCDELITCPHECYRQRCDLGVLAHVGLLRQREKNNNMVSRLNTYFNIKTSVYLNDLPED